VRKVGELLGAGRHARPARHVLEPQRDRTVGLIVDGEQSGRGQTACA
jgi:hypothetical protein